MAVVHVTSNLIFHLKSVNIYLHAYSITSPDNVQKIAIDSLELWWEFHKIKNLEVKICNGFVRFVSMFNVHGMFTVFAFLHREETSSQQSPLELRLLISVNSIYRDINRCRTSLKLILMSCMVP